DIRWLPTRQPVVTDFWRTDVPPPTSAVFSSVANWNTKGKDIDWRGDKYIWSKAREFLRFVDAPGAIGEPVEMATNIQDPATRELLTAKGWRIVDAAPISIDADGYVKYVRGS